MRIEQGDSGARELSLQEQQKVANLQRRDREVRAHERAHMGAAGSHARGGASFEFEVGPDGKRYAVGGEVSIDSSAVSGDPAATARKMKQIQRAALAPADPSATDRRVAAQAAKKALDAQREVQSQEGAPLKKGSLVDLNA